MMIKQTTERRENPSREQLIQQFPLYSLKEKVQDTDAFMQQVLNNLLPEAVFENNASGFSLVVLSNRYKITIHENNLTVSDLKDKKEEFQNAECPFSALKNVQDRLNFDSQGLDESLNFKGGLLGYLGFGLTESSLSIKKQKSRFLDIDDAIFFVPDSYIEVNHNEKTIYYVSSISFEHSHTLKDSVSKVQKKESPSYDLPDHCPALTLATSKEQFIENVKTAKKHIKNGEAFQIVLSQRFSYPMPAETLNVFQELRRQSKSIYNYYFNFGKYEYFGASPESFIKIKDRKISFRALAGTRPRGADEASDKALENELRQCPKENAEHMMLVDLGRNDLGRVSKSGSISVGKIAEVLKYPNVMHLSTDLEGELENNIDSLTAAKSCFPRGTVSGAPKRRALEIISELEDEQRGIYSGAVGVIDLKGDIDMAIAIRSATVKDRVAHIQAGAGIVYDSIAENEYEETIHKAGAILKPIESLWRKMSS